MVIKTLTPEMKLTQEQINMLDELDQYPIVFEDDCPELTPEMVEAFRKAARDRDLRKDRGSFVSEANINYLNRIPEINSDTARLAEHNPINYPD